VTVDRDDPLGRRPAPSASTTASGTTKPVVVPPVANSSVVNSIAAVCRAAGRRWSGLLAASTIRSGELDVRARFGRLSADVVAGAVIGIPNRRICGYSPGVPTFRIKEAADLLGVSADTLRRWADGGRIETTTDGSGRLGVDGAVLARFAEELAHDAAHLETGDVAAASVRNRFSGLVTRVVKDTVMAQVEIQAGPHRFVSLLSREAVDELGLEPGVLAVAAVKATNVSVEIPRMR